jgi:tight adherence protein B
VHLVIGTVIFLAVFLLVLAVYFIGEDRREREKRRILVRLLPKDGGGRSRNRIERRLDGAFERYLARYIDLRPLARLLDEADVEIPVGRLLFFSAAFGIGGFLLAAVLFGSLLGMAAALAVGLLAPVGYLYIRRQRRETALVSQLPDAVDMISRGLRAGQGLDAALMEVAHTFPEPAGSELKRIYEEMTMGLSFEAAVRSFEQRFTRVADVKMLCAALLIQRETGGNLTTILDNIAHTIRERFTFYRQVRALSAEGRLSAIILGCLPVAFGLITWVLRPDYVYMLFTHPTGKQALLVALVLEAFGFALMFRLAKVEA